MEGSTIYIKNMVCNRCIMVVEQLLTNMGFTLRHIELGKVIIEEQLSQVSDLDFMPLERML